MPYADYKVTDHLPRVCKLNPTIAAILKGDKFCILDNRYVDFNNSYQEYNVGDCNIQVSEELEVDEEWFKTSIINKDVYIPVMGGLSWLPLTMPTRWIIVPSGETVNTKLELFSSTESKHWVWPVAKVNFGEEKTLAELCCNAYKYHFDFNIGQFVPHDDPEWNLVKGLTRKYSTILSGGDEERHADYGRIILFLLSKVELTDEERALFTPLLEFVPSVKQLKSTVERETLIQRFVSEAKKSPTKFLLWGEDWAHFWWENGE